MTTCYRAGGCGPFEMYSCNECPASKPEYLKNNKEDKKPQKIYIPFGDWSDDGHGKCEKVLIELEDTAALGKSVQNIKKKYGENIFHDIANDYGFAGISPAIFQILEENNFDFEQIGKTEDISDDCREQKNWHDYMMDCVNSDDEDAGMSNSFTLETIKSIYFFLLKLGGANFRICFKDEDIPLFTDETVGYGCFDD